MMYPLGTVIFQVQLVFGGKSFGKLGLVKNPLDPVRDSPESQAVKEINNLGNEYPQHCKLLLMVIPRGKCILSILLHNSQNLFTS